MRQVLMGDIIAAARSLVNVPPPMQTAAVHVMLYRAHVADKVMKRTGLPHSAWGNGSLLACAARRLLCQSLFQAIYSILATFGL